MTLNNPTILLTDAFPDWIEGIGIFDLLTSPPWGTEISPVLLDVDYFGNHSGQKKCSPLVYKLLDEDHEITVAGRQALANIIKLKYYPIWEKLYATYNLSVTRDPFANVDITERMERKLDGSDVTDGEATKNLSGTANSDLTHGEVVTGGGSETRTTDNSRHGFNSDEAVPTDSSVSVLTRNSPTETHSGTDSTDSEYNQGEINTEEKTVSIDREEEITKTRKGIDGGKTSQELIAAERELWIEDFFSRVYRDLDSVLATLVYPRVHKDWTLEKIF